MLIAEELIQGNYYFTVFFYDEDFSIPHVLTYIYVGKNLPYGKKTSPIDEWFFQDAQSFVKYGSFVKVTKKNKHALFIADEDTLDLMYDIDGLIVKLSRLGKVRILAKQGDQHKPKGKPKVYKGTFPTPADPAPSNQITKKYADGRFTISTPQPTKKVLQEYEQAIIKYPESAELRLYYELALRKTGKIQPAAEQIREAIRLKPNENYPHSVLADLLMDAGDTKASIAEKRKALRLVLKAGGFSQNEVIARWDLAEALRKAKKTSEARSELEKAVKLQSHLVNDRGESKQLLSQLEDLSAEYLRKGY